MPVNLVPEDDLRTVLRPHRVVPDTFQASVRERLQIAERQQAADPLVGLSPLSRAAAALMPWQILAGGKGNAAAVQFAPAGIGYKLLSYLAFPAICLFLLAGATVVTFVKIRSIRGTSPPELDGPRGDYEGLKRWWSDNQLGAWLVFAAMLALSALGATSLLFLLYIISLGLLLHVLSSFAKRGLGNRLVISQSLGMGLLILFQTAMFPAVGDGDIHFVDQMLVAAVFLCGAMALLPLGRQQGILQRVFTRGVVVVAVPLLALWVYLCLSPVSAAQIKRHVESFDNAPHESVSWQHWEIPARWAIDSKLDPDLSKPRRLLAQEIDGEQNPFVLGVAFRTGLVQTEHIGQLRDYEERHRMLIHDVNDVSAKQRLLSVEQEDWVIRAAVLRQDLSPEERDHLQTRLNLTLENLATNMDRVLQTALIVTELLDVIDRPVDRDRHRSRIHDWLRKFHSKKGGGFQLAGGFMSYWTPDNSSYWTLGGTASMDSTSQAVQLMAIYGIPDDLDLDWVRSYLRTKAFRVGEERWMAPVTLDRLNRLPGLKPASWWRTLYYERNLLAALVLVAMCIYATLSEGRQQASATI